MTIIDNILNRLGFVNKEEVYKAMEDIKAAVQNPPAWLRAQAEFDELQPLNMTIPKTQSLMYSKLSYISTAISHVAEQGAIVPFEVFQQVEGEEKETIPSHPFEILLQRPNPTESRMEIFNTTVANYKLTGNGFWWMNKANEFAAPAEIWTLPSHQVEPIPDEKMFIKGYEYDPGHGDKLLLLPWEVVHFKRYNPHSRYWGLSQIMQIAIASLSDIEMQEHNLKLFKGSAATSKGFLAFADAIPEPEFDKMKEDIKTAAEKRNLMMLRSVGKGGVEWVQSGLTQQEMQFLEGREFNKNEIFDWLAPGLYSWLALNSTEANSRSGKEAFAELAVWPVLKVFGEKITNEILPLYGEGLIGEFEDIRPVDIGIKLQEQQAFERTHTVEETRKEWYGHEPLGDERDNELAAGVSFSFGNQPEEAEDEDKEDERTKFRRFVKRRGQEEMDDFKFYHLNEDEQMAVKAEFAQTDFMRLSIVMKALDEMREVAVG